MTLNSRAATEAEQQTELAAALPQLSKFAEDFTDAMMFCEEIGDGEHRHHLQGWFRCKKAMRINEIHNKFPTDSICRSMHLETMRGGPAASVKYCTKDRGKFSPQIYFELGDIEQYMQKRSRTPAKDTLEKYPSYTMAVQQDPDTVNRARNVLRDSYTIRDGLDHTQRDIKVFWYYGPTASGKSYAARKDMQFMLGDDWWVKTGSAKWFDGYSGQRGMVYDEFRRDMLTEVGGLPFLLTLLDRYVVQCQVKGGHVLFKAVFIIFTTQNDPVKEFTYHSIKYGRDFADEKLAQLIRRLSRVYEYNYNSGLKAFSIADKTDEMRTLVGLEPRTDGNAPEPPFEDGGIAFREPAYAQLVRAQVAPNPLPASFVYGSGGVGTPTPNTLAHAPVSQSLVSQSLVTQVRDILDGVTPSQQAAPPQTAPQTTQ